MVSNEYFLLFKTADAEKRCWKNLAQERRKVITPLVELTRGKKIRGQGKDADGNPLTAEQLLHRPNIYGFERNWQATFELMTECEFFFADLTREPSLACFEIEHVSDSANGYIRWIEFIETAAERYENLRPTLIVNPREDEDEAEYVSNVHAQFDALSKSFDKMAYRVAVLEDDAFLYDLEIISDKVTSYSDQGSDFYVILDHEFIRPGNGQVHAKRTIAIIDEIRAVCPAAQIICLATSFPKSVTDIGDEEHDIFRVEEMYLFNEVKKAHPRVFYGDYGSINPIRNDEELIVRGWRPRIDFISSIEGLHTFYYREQRRIVDQEEVEIRGQIKTRNIRAPYSDHYASVARSILRDARYEDINLSWGNEQIKLAAKGAVPSNAPSYWISVRMEIHITQVLGALDLGPLEILV